MDKLKAIWAFIQKWWKALLGTVVFLYLLVKRSQLKTAEQEATLAQSTATDAALAQKQSDIASQVQQEQKTNDKAQANIPNESLDQIAKDLNNV